MYKTKINIINIILLVACSSEESKMTANTCSLEYQYSELNQHSTYRDVIYGAKINDECNKVLTFMDGEYTIKIDIKTRPSTGYLSIVNYGDVRTIEIEEDSGSFTLDRHEKSLVISGCELTKLDDNFFLPWNVLPSKFYLTFRFPGNVSTEMYPYDVEQTIEVSETLASCI